MEKTLSLRRPRPWMAREKQQTVSAWYWRLEFALRSSAFCKASRYSCSCSLAAKCSEVRFPSFLVLLALFLGFDGSLAFSSLSMLYRTVVMFGLILSCMGTLSSSPSF